MAKIVIQNQTSPATPDCGFTAMYVNCITWLPTFKRDDWTECSFVLSDGCWMAWDMLKCIYDPTCVHADVFAMDNMHQGICNQYVTCDQVNCWNNKANACDIPTDVCQLCNSSNYISNATCDLCNYYLKCETYTKEEVECMVSNFWGFCVVENLPESWCTNLIYLKWPIGCWCDKYEEYIYNTCWTLIGETSTDLSNYAKCCDIPDISNLAQCCDIPDTSDFVQCCDIPDFNELAKCCDIPDVSDFVQCCDIPDLCNVAHICDIPTDNCQLSNWCWYTKCTWDMQKCLYDPNNCATDVYNMDNMVDGTNKVAMTTAERTKLAWIDWCNTWDETAASIKCKLWISTLSWANTWDETQWTIKTKLWAANCADDWYLMACDFANFSNKQNQLISWENIITINGCTILRCWDICIENLGWDMKACMYDPYWHCSDAFNRANHTWTQSYTTISWLWTAATRDVGTCQWNIPALDCNWKLPDSVIPAQDIVDVCVFNSEADMLSWCDANRWDMAIRTDIATTFVNNWWCYCCLSSWTELPTPASPVTSVNWQTGNVCLTTDNIDDTNSSNKYVTAAEKTCWCGKADPYVSWCTIKTINWCSVLGCWNLCIWDIIQCVNGKTGNVVLSTDDISDTGTSHLYVTNAEKQCWNCKIDCADAIVDNCQLCNSCWYITSWNLCCLAQCCDIPTDVCQLNNGCWYATWNDLALYPKCCDLPDFGDFARIDDIPTDNIELSNGCCYITQSALCWYTQCCDIPDFSDFAHINDIPTNNIDLINGCWYITNAALCNYAQCCDVPSISWLLQECCVATINWCCLTCWWDICICAQWTWINYICWSTYDEIWCKLACCLCAWCDWKTLSFEYDNKLFTPICFSAWSVRNWLIYYNQICNCHLDCNSMASYYKHTFLFDSCDWSFYKYCDILKTTVATYIATNCDYVCPYMPTYDWSPATKAYVDCSICNTWVCNKVTCWDEICICCDAICSRTNTNAAWFGIYWCWDYTAYWREWITRPNDCVYTFDKCDSGIAQMCDIPQEIDTWLWRTDHIDCSDCCILCEWRQLIVEWKFTVDWELTNNWVIYII